MRVLATRLARAFQQQQALESRRLAAARARLVRELRAPLPQTMRLAQLKATLTRAGRQRVAIASRALTRCGESLELLNPSAVLDRGYAIVTGRDGSIVVDSRLVARGDAVELTFARGRAGAMITTTDEG
jgi:exodeoxyribonuclease VII large subunit